MEEAQAQRALLEEQLATADQSLGFLLVLVASVLLSFWTVTVQRRGLCLVLAGEEEQAAALPDVLPARRTAGAMVIGSLGFFLCLALRAWEDARSGAAAACRSPSANLWASLFVLLAALLRFLDLRNQAAGQDGSEAGTLPA